MSKKIHSSNGSNSKTINLIFISLISAFMLIIPFYRGLFFRVNYIPAIAFISFVFTAYMVYKLKDKSYRVLDTYMDLSVLLIPVAYLISFFFAVNAKDAFDMFLVYCSYFMMYKLTSDLSAKDEKYKNIFINVIIASTFVLSFTAMLSIAGLVDINGVFVGKRLYGLYQYANTTASVLGVGIILALNKLVNEANIKKAVIYQMALTALLSSFIFTLSRGGYLVFAGVLLLNFFLIKARAKLKLLMSLLVALLSSSMLIYKFYTLTEEAISAIWVHYVVSIIVSAVLIYIAYTIKNRVKFRISERAINIVLIAVVAIFAGVFIFLFSARETIEYRIEHQASQEKSYEYTSIGFDNLKVSSDYILEFNVKASIESARSYGILVRSYNSKGELTELLNHFESTGSEFMLKKIGFTTLEDTDRVMIYLYNYESGSYTVYKDVVLIDTNEFIVKKMERFKYIPSAIADRLTDINLETENASLRVYFAKDGINIIKDYPIAGAGGGAWKNLYRQYQSIPYNTTEVHNFYVQFGTEVGIIGLGVLAGLLLLFIISMIRGIISASNYNYVYLAAMILLIHSTIDFNLSLASVGYLLWMLIGIASSDRKTPLIGKVPQRYILVPVLVLSLFIIYTSISVYYGIRLGNQAAEMARKKEDYTKAIEIYEKASKLDKYNGAYRIDMSQLMVNQLRNTKDKKYLDGFSKQVSLLQKYEPYNFQYASVLCNMYLSIGNFGEANKIVERKLQYEPLVPQSYILVIDLNYEIAQYCLDENKTLEAIPYLEKLLETNVKAEEVNERLKTPMKFNESYYQKVDAASKALEMIKALPNKQ